MKKICDLKRNSRKKVREGIGKKIMAMLLATAMSISLTACGGNQSADSGKTNEKTELNIAYQYGMAYAPLQVMKEQGLIEKYYPDVTVNWQVLNSGSAITEGMVAGSIDVGAMGVAPAITAIMKGVPCKIFSSMSSQPHKILSNNPDIKSLKDITSETKIALVNIGSIQHILLAMAAEKELGDARALDNNILAMSHPDGMTALLAGSVECQLTTSPYIFKAEAEEGIHSLTSISEVWPEGNSFIVALASEKLHDDNPELYQAVTKALADAIVYMNENQEEVAAMLCENEGVDSATMLSWLQDSGCGYSTETVGVMQMAEFMKTTGFIEKAPENYSDLVYENVKGN